MLERLKLSFVIYIIIIIAFIGSAFDTYQTYSKNQVVAPPKGDFTQPSLSEGVYPWSVRSIDTQIVSKHWPNVTQTQIDEQIKLVAGLGVNYIAIGTPYDKAGEMRMWAQSIHKLGLHVWFRSHWAEWEGDEGKPASLSPNDYLSRTSVFIQNNPDLFMAGDSFTVAVEPEQVGIGLGKRFLTWDQYRSFILSEVTVANKAFTAINLHGQIYTNWISVNGWIVENEFTSDLVSKLGLITVDHFVGQSNTIGTLNDADQVINQTTTDLDRFHNRWQVPILLGEWGYQIFQPVPDDTQAFVVNQLLTQLTTRSYIIGVNYWTHMGNSASLIGDEFGANLKYRPAALIVKQIYDPYTPAAKPKASKVPALK